MNDTKFDQNDREFMDKLKSIREQKIPESVLKNFSTDVHAKISGSVPARHIPGLSMGIVAFSVVFLLGLGFGASYLMLPKTSASSQPAGKNAAAPVDLIEAAPQASKITAQQAYNQDEVAQEIALLRELGAWTEDDEEVIGISPESVLNELEFPSEPEALGLLSAGSLTGR